MKRKSKKSKRPRLEHDTDGERCWCNPRRETYRGGDIIIHNDVPGPVLQ